MDGDKATSKVITNSFLLIGLDRLTQGKRAFINFTENLIKSEIPTMFPKDSIAIEILENITVDTELIEACRKMEEQGYVIAIDDFEYPMLRRYQELLEYVNLIKVDFQRNNVYERRQIIKQLANGKIRFLAEKVENKEEFDQAFQMGYHYFQGYYFSKPLVIKEKDLSSYKNSYLEIIRKLDRAIVEFRSLASIIERDVTLSYKFLKIANSVSYYSRSKITSLEVALVRLGFEEIKKWTYLLILHDICKNKSNEIVRISLIRAKYGELIAAHLGLGKRKKEVFIMGLFSKIDVFIERTMENILEELRLSQDIRDAMLGKENIFRSIFDIILAHEEAQWEKLISLANKLQLDPSKLSQLHMNALDRTNRTYRLLII
jgi:EAL and modified HD-GYP domain-containing signal transduction protein